jgi:uncharacterized iron-regulated protein
MFKKSSILSIIFAFSLVFSFSAFAKAQIYDGNSQNQTDLQSLVDRVKPGSVVIVGEFHNQKSVRDQQVELLNALKNKGLEVSTGLEFFNYTDQIFVDQYRSNKIDEATFLKIVNWGGFDFNLYKDQLLFGEFGLGINLTRDVTKIISKQGLAALTPDQNKLLPPNFTIGRDSYRQRFFEEIRQHVPVSNLENYFVAQSAWDDTMAWQTVEFQKQHPDQVFVIFVGEFHVQYGGGLPYRLKERLNAENLPVDIVTVSQVYTDGMTDQEILDSLKPSVDEGPRSDFIWLSK